MKRTLMFLAALVVVAAGALVFRLPELVTTWPPNARALHHDLAMRPMHGDEAIHTAIFERLWKEHDFVYDPHDYHGPTLHYATLPVVWLSGEREYKDTDEFTYRIVPLAFGVGLVLMLALLADGMGPWAVICAGVLTAISPSMVFFSRYYIQEMLLVFFTFGAIASGWRFVRSRGIFGKVMWAVIGGLFVGLMHGTKETWVIAGACAALAAGLAWAWGKLMREGPAAGTLDVRGPGVAEQHGGASRTWAVNLICAALALIVAAAVGATILTAGFKHPHAIIDSILAYKANFARGSGENPHAHAWDFYLQMLVFWQGQRGVTWSEGLILALAAVGIGAGLRREKTGTATVFSLSLVRFLAFYTLAMIAAYSAIRYKTPWCLLSFEHGLILLAGVGAVYLVKRAPYFAIGAGIAIGLMYLSIQFSRPPRGEPVTALQLPKLWILLVLLGGLALAIALPRWGVQVLAALVLAGWAAQLGNQAYRMNYVPERLDRDYNPYIYGHPTSQVLKLADLVNELARASPHGKAMTVTVIGRDCWPIPWYLRSLSQVGCWDSLSQMTPQEETWQGADVLIFASSAYGEMTDALTEGRVVTNHGLRKGGVLAALCVKEKLWEEMLRARRGTKGQ